ncbi:MAG TPA: radical SAM protein [Acetobacteraceae bacterium]|nr:radical SAM protein [Acetobacteraceae bacterium]
MLLQQAAREAQARLQQRPRLRALAKRADLEVARARHGIATVLPGAIRPSPRQITIAVTAHCNLRCQGCRYGRDFMPGSVLPLALVRDLLDDARQGGVATVRFYGGEPLLHPELPDMIRHACRIGLRPYVTSNATHLGTRIDALYEAGLRLVTIGFYGTEADYDAYTQRAGHFARLERSLEQVRRRYGRELELQLNFVLLRQSCTTDALHRAWEFARRFDMFFHVDLANYAAPFFVQGFDNDLQLRPEDRGSVETVALAMLALKRAEPERFLHSVEFIRSVPDWMLQGPAMRVRCDAYELLWVGADGTVQLCDVALPLGNVHQTRLRDILFSRRHREAALAAFRLDCPNCTCKAETRIVKDAAAMRRYGRRLPGEAG